MPSKQQTPSGYPKVKIKRGPDCTPGFYVVLAEMRPGVYEMGYGCLEPDEDRRVKAAISDWKPRSHEALAPLLHKVLGWRLDMIPPGSGHPSLANRAPHSDALRSGQFRIKKPKKPSALERVDGPDGMPDLADLKPDMPLTLAEACRLVFRDHIKPATLRAEARRGHLVIERIGRRDFVTLAALAEMRERCRVGTA